MPKPIDFSARTRWDRSPNALARHLAAARATGADIVDLTESNPTACGFGTAPQWLDWLSQPAGARYRPEPLGLLSARRAVARYYQQRGYELPVEQLLLSASSSESYAWLFKLLADEGDEILVPQPSYPLYPFLAELEGVRLVPYPLLQADDWRVDTGAIRAALSERTRAIVLVNPNNPTGNFVHQHDARAIIELAREAGVALIVDEVFADYPHRPLPATRCASFVAQDEVLCFVLNGLSKVALLPHFKLGWIVVRGPRSATGEAMQRLSIIADCYLSVATAVQLALPHIVEALPALQARVRQRLGRNLAYLDEALQTQGPGGPVRRLACDGGWYAMVEVPRTRSDDEWVAHLLSREALLVHPGYFFDADEAGMMVVSLLLEPERFGPAIARAVHCWAAG